MLKGLKDGIFRHVSDLLGGYNVLRQGNRQSSNLKVALVDVKPCKNLSRHDCVELKSGHNSSLEHGRVYTHGSIGVQSNTGKIELQVRCCIIVFLPDMLLASVRRCDYLGLTSLSSRMSVWRR